MRTLGNICFLLAFVVVCRGESGASDGVQFKLSQQSASDGRIAWDVEVPGLSGLKYTLLRSTDFSQWSVVDAPSVGPGSAFVAESEGETVYFKVRVEVDDTIVSQVTTVEYPVHVYVPEGYAASTRDYPVIYATDGQWISDGFSSAIAAKGKEVILVTVEQGPGDRRAIDYLLPGATDYFEFFTEELMPAIEAVYRVDASERTICGTSYGGLLVGLVLLMDDAEAPRFTNYLSFDGSFWTHRSATNALEQTRFAAGGDMEVTLYLTSATAGQNNDAWVTYFKNLIESRGYGGLRVIRKSYPVEHNDVAQPSFEEALDELF